MCWGSSDGARLGERTGAVTLAAATVPGSESWVANSLALGELGNGGALAETFARPVQMSGITNAIGLTSNNQRGNSIPSLMIDDAHYHRCALLNTPRDSVVCWGSNNHLQLGDALGPRAAPGPTGTDP